MNLPVLRRSRPSPGPSAEPSVQALSRRVALTTTAIVVVAYAIIAVAVYAISWNVQLNQVDTRLNAALEHPVGNRPPGGGGGDFPNGFNPDQADPNRPQIQQWIVTPDGSIAKDGLTTIDLPAQYAGVSGTETVTIDGQQYRVAGVDRDTGAGTVHVVAAQSLSQAESSQTMLLAAEIGIGGALVLVVFLGAIAIGRRVAQPIEDARQRQLEFTADASHELRTPLSVIEAQTTLALAKERPGEWYRNAFTRIDGESKRIRRLVDDMLWLARFDATRGHPNAEPVDVNVLAGATVDRFRAVAEARHLVLGIQGEDGQIVTVPPDWLDRLLGVLMDNACKYSPEGGSVVVSVAGEGRRVRLTVDDSGPGIPAEERGRIFDRFHRATDKASGAGLGLAIGDAIVKATGGRWAIGTSPAGGASISVSWPRSMSGGRERHAPDDSRADAEA